MSKFFIIILFYLLMIIPISLISHPSWGIVVDENENIYFADIAHNGMGSVWRLNKSGKLDLLLGNFHAHNVSLDNKGNIITAHGEITHTLVKIYQNGKIDTLFHTDDYKEFFGGNCDWSNKENRIIYSLREHKHLRKLSVDGEQSNFGDYQFKWNQTVYVSPNGTIYATEIGIDNGCVVKIDTLGNSTIIAKDLITKLDRPKDEHNDILLGITEGCDGNIYVAETAGRRVIKISENGENETFYQSDENWLPTAIDFFSGDAYILEYKETGKNVGPKIIKIDESGNKSLIFDYDEYENKN